MGPAFHRTKPRGRERHGRAGRKAERVGATESNALQCCRSDRLFQTNASDELTIVTETAVSGAAAEQDDGV